MKQFLSLVLLCFMSFCVFSQNNVSVSDDPAYTPNPSAVLDVHSLDKGLLVPRMNQAARDLITLPAKGLLIYQTDGVAGFYYYNGLGWVAIGGSGGSGGNTLDMAYDQGGAGGGRAITADSGEVEVSTSTPNGIALRLTNNNTGVALLASSTNSANTFSTIQSETSSNSNIASAVIGNTTGAAWGVSGQVSSTATSTAGLYGSNLRTNGGHGVLGIGFNGMVGQTNYSSGNAVWGENTDNIAPLGNGVGVAGIGYMGVVGQDRYNGGQLGAYGVFSNGDLGASGLKTFLIDHPQDPENKALRHFSMESEEVLNVYRGTVVLDQAGEAKVQLPDYFDLINTNPSYHLTPIGSFAQLFIKEEINDGVFVVAGGQPNQKISWTVYAERNDLYLQQYPEKRSVTIEKREGQKGKYYQPQLYGSDKSIFPKSSEKFEQVELPQLNNENQEEK